MPEHDISSCCRPPSPLHVRTVGPDDRRAVASSPLRAGSVVLRNAPLAHALHRSSRDERCARCLSKRGSNRRTTTANGGGGSVALARCSRCPRSSSAWYCSRECQRADHHVHRFECRASFPPVVADEASLLVRTYVQLRSEESSGSCVCVGQHIANDNDDEGGGAKDSSSSDCSVVRCGARHFRSLAQSSRPLDAADTLAIDAATAAVQSRPKILPPGETPSETRSRMEDALRTFRVNNFGVSDPLLNVVGVAVYPLGALLNHSCVPNCVLRYAFDGDLGPVMEIVVARDVEAGEELTHSYVELAAPTDVRRQRLEAVHGFRCGCGRCLGRCTVLLPEDFAACRDISEWVLEHFDPRFASRGVDATTAGEVIIDVGIDDVMGRAAPAGYASGGNGSTMTHSEAYSAARRKREEAKQHMANDDLDQELICLEEAVALLSDPHIVPPFSVDMYEARGDLLSTLVVSGRTADALEQCKYIVAFLCIVLSHVRNHPLLGLQLFTLGDLYEGIGELIRAKETFLWARDVLAVSQGQRSEMVQRLNEKLS